MVRPLPGVIVLLLAATPALLPDRVHGVREGFPGADRGRQASVLSPRAAHADPVDPRLARVRAYQGLGAEALKRIDGRVRVAELLSIVADSTAPKEVRAAAAAAMTADIALVNDVDLSFEGQGSLRPRLVLLTRVYGLLLSDDEITRSLAKSLCEGLMPGAWLAIERLSPEELRTYVERRRAETMTALAGQGLEEIVRRRIEERVRAKGVAFHDVQAWLRKELIDEAFTELAGSLRTWDPSIRAAEARALFLARPLRPDGWRRASYGTGSFVVDPPPPPPPPKPPRIPLPKPPTRDAWWASAPGAERLEFFWATFVEIPGLYEVRVERVLCPACDGTGRQTRRLGGGFAQEWLCVRCGGVNRSSRNLRYR